MITFNGVSLDSVGNIRIEDIKVSPIRYSPVVRPRAIRFGSEFIRMGGGERTITVSFACLERNEIIRHETLMNLSQWARTDAEYRIELPTDPARYLTCVCTSKPEPSTRAWYENKLKLVFTCYNNPYWTTKQEKSVACGTQFNVMGDAPPLMRITHTFAADASTVAYSDGTDTMTFSVIPTGDLVIDLNAQTARVGGSSIMYRYYPSGTFLVPKTGVQTITGTGTIRYRERFE